MALFAIIGAVIGISIRTGVHFHQKQALKKNRRAQHKALENQIAEAQKKAFSELNASFEKCMTEVFSQSIALETQCEYHAEILQYQITLFLDNLELLQQALQACMGQIEDCEAIFKLSNHIRDPLKKHPLTDFVEDLFLNCNPVSLAAQFGAKKALEYLFKYWNGLIDVDAVSPLCNSSVLTCLSFNDLDPSIRKLLLAQIPEYRFYFKHCESQLVLWSEEDLNMLKSMHDSNLGVWLSNCLETHLGTESGLQSLERSEVDLFLEMFVLGFPPTCHIEIILAFSKILIEKGYVRALYQFLLTQPVAKHLSEIQVKKLRQHGVEMLNRGIPAIAYQFFLNSLDYIQFRNQFDLPIGDPSQIAPAKRVA